MHTGCQLRPPVVLRTALSPGPPSPSLRSSYFHQHLPESSPISSPPFPSAFGWVGASPISHCPTTQTDRQAHSTASSPSPLLLSQIPDYSFLVSNVLVPAPNSTLPLCLCCPEPFCEMRVITPGWDCGAANPGFTGRPSSPRTRVHKAKRELPSPACFPPTFSTVSHSRVSLSFLISSVSHPLNLARSPLGSLLGHLLTPYSTSFGLSPSFPCLCLSSQRYLLGRKLCLLPMSNPTLAVCSCSGPFIPL